MKPEEVAQLLRIDAARLANVARSLQLVCQDCPQLYTQLALVWQSCEACEVIIRAEGRRLTGAPVRSVPVRYG